MTTLVAAATPAPPDWYAIPLRDLLRHLVDAHHEYLRMELPVLTRTIGNMARLHAETCPEVVPPLWRAFSRLAEDIERNLNLEETVLFPAIARLEEAALRGGRPPKFAFGSIRNPVSMVEQEHNRVLEVLEEIRSLTGNYRFTAAPCEMFRVVYQSLQALEGDIRTHVYLENDILFPRAIQLEADRAAET
jgi:regulator of cell morphogenesis and NO signaling